MAKIADCIMEFKITGDIPIDLNIAKKGFDDKCIIAKWHDEYRLKRVTHHGKRCTFKINITKDDALFLIKELNLTEIPSAIFNNASMFRLI